MSMRKWFKRFRSAITGLFVTREEAEASPETTVAEKVEIVTPTPPTIVVSETARPRKRAISEANHKAKP